MSGMEDLCFESENEVFMTGEEEFGQETEPYSKDFEARKQEPQLSIEVPSDGSVTSIPPGSAWSSSSEEEEREEEVEQDLEDFEVRQHQEAVVIGDKPADEEQGLDSASTGAMTSEISSGQVASGPPLSVSVNPVVAGHTSEEEPVDLEAFPDFDGTWSASGDAREGATIDEHRSRPRLRAATVGDNNADDESSPTSPSGWQIQEHLAVETRPHLRGRRPSIMEQYKYKDNDLKRVRGNLETAIGRAVHLIDPAKQHVAQLATYERPHEGLERMGDPRLRRHLRPGEHANTPRKPSPLRRSEGEEAVTNESRVVEPRPPECVLLPSTTYDEERGWRREQTRHYLPKKWRTEASDKIMPEDIERTSNRLEELLNEDDEISIALDQESLTDLISACRQVRATTDSTIRRALLISADEVAVEQSTSTGTTNADASSELSVPLSILSAPNDSDDRVVTPVENPGNDSEQSPLPTSAQELEDATGMDTEEALAVAEEWNARCDKYHLPETKPGLKSEGAAERLAKKRTKAVFEWDYTEYLMRRHGYERPPPPLMKLPEDPRERAEFARAMAHLYRYERDEARRKIDFLLDENQHVRRLRGERDRLLTDVNDYKEAIGQNFAEIAALEERLRQKCRHCGKSSEIWDDGHVEIAAAAKSFECLDSGHAGLEEQLVAAKERIQALQAENEKLEVSLEKRKAKLTELKGNAQTAQSWKQRADAARAQAEQVQELADCELRRRANESVYRDQGTDPDHSLQQQFEERAVVAAVSEARQQLESQYEELLMEYTDCKNQLEQSKQNHHDDLRKSGDEQREQRAALDQLRGQYAVLESQLQQLRQVRPVNAPNRTTSTSTSTQRPCTPPGQSSSHNSAQTPSMLFTQPTPPKIETEVDSRSSDDAPSATPSSAHTPCTPGFTAYLADKPPPTPVIERTESWHQRNDYLLQSRTYIEVSKRMEAFREEQRQVELRAKERREKAYFDLFGTRFQPLTESQKKKTYYGLAHKSKKEPRDVEVSRSQERIKKKSNVEATFFENREAKLTAAREKLNARSPTKPYREFFSDAEDEQAVFKRRLWGSVRSVKPLDG